MRCRFPITAPRRTIRTVSAANLVDGNVDKEAIQGRIIVLGATATGAGDFFPTPFDSLMPGVEIISTAITHLVAGDGVVRDRSVRVVEAVTTILLPILLVGLLAWRAKRGRSPHGQRGDAGMGSRERDWHLRTAYGSTPRRRSSRRRRRSSCSVRCNCG